MCVGVTSSFLQQKILTMAIRDQEVLTSLTNFKINAQLSRVRVFGNVEVKCPADSQHSVGNCRNIEANLFQ